MWSRLAAAKSVLTRTLVPALRSLTACVFSHKCTASRPRRTHSRTRTLVPSPKVSVPTSLGCPPPVGKMTVSVSVTSTFLPLCSALSTSASTCSSSGSPASALYQLNDVAHADMHVH